MCEMGPLHVDKVTFDQVNSTGIRGGDHFDEATQYEWEEDSLVEETLMSGTQGEKASTCLKGGKGSHSKTCYGLLNLWPA